MKINYTPTFMLAFLTGLVTYSQNETEIRKTMQEEMMQNRQPMKTYVIEREIPDVGKLTPEELKGISQKSNQVLSTMGPGIEWQHSYVTDDRVFCVYKAENKELLTEHAKNGGFPINTINELTTVINPATAKD